MIASGLGSSSGAYADGLVLDGAYRIGRGAFADVFAPAHGRTAIKLFRRITDPELADAVPYIFRSEVRAFTIASQHEDLSMLVPAFFGVATADCVTQRNVDVSGDYWLGYAYAMERITITSERKFGSFFETKMWDKRYRAWENLFAAAGIKHIGDASVLNWRSRRPLLIDFATRDEAADRWQPSAVNPVVAGA